MNRDPAVKKTKQPGAPLYEQAVRLLILILAQTGFYFCFITEYKLSGGISPYLFTLAACLIYLLIFSLKSHALLFALSIALSGVFVWFHADELVQSWLFLMKQLFEACGGVLPDLMSQLLREEGADISYALCSMMLISTILSAYAVTRGESIFLLCLASVPALFPGLFFSLSGNTASLFAVLAAWFAFSLFRRYGGLLSASVSDDADISMKVSPDRVRKRTSLRSLSAVAAVMMAAAVFGIASLILPEKGYEKPDLWNELRQAVYNSKIGDLIGRPNDGLSHGRFRDLSEIRFTGDTALKARVSERLSLYVRNYTGTVYTDDGWEEVPERTYETYAIGTNPLLMHAEADKVQGNTERTYLFSIKSEQKSISSLALPQGLLTGTDDLDGTRYRNDTGIETVEKAGIAGYSVYALQLRNAFATFQVSSDADPREAVREGYESVIRSRYGKSSEYNDIEHYLRYIFDYYTALPDETARCGRALCEQFGITGATASGTLNLAQVCSSVQSVFNRYCSYSYDPPAIPADADFSTYFMNESRQGYCIHFATAAAVMLRSLGIPARYAEGYIIVQADYQKVTDDEGYFAIEDTHAHAWVEVFDPVQLEWIPVEMTPNNGNGSESGSLAPTLTPPPTVTPEPETSVDPDAETGEETTSPQPERTPDPGQTEEPDTDGSQPEETGTEPEENHENSGDSNAAMPEKGQAPVINEGQGEGGDSSPQNSLSPDGARSGATGGGRVLLGILIPVLAAGCAVFLYFFDRKKRQARLTGKPSASVLYAVKEADAMIRLAGGHSIDSGELPEEYADRILWELPWICRQDILTVYETAQETIFSSRTIREADRNAVLKSHGNLRRSVTEHAGLFKKIWIILRYPDEGLNRPQTRFLDTEKRK